MTRNDRFQRILIRLCGSEIRTINRCDHDLDRKVNTWWISNEAKPSLSPAFLKSEMESRTTTGTCLIINLNFGEVQCNMKHMSMCISKNMFGVTCLLVVFDCMDSVCVPCKLSIFLFFIAPLSSV